MGLARGVQGDVGALLARHGQTAHDHRQDEAQPHRRSGAPSQFKHARRHDRRVGTAKGEEEIDGQRAGKAHRPAQIGVGRKHQVLNAEALGAEVLQAPLQMVQPVDAPIPLARIEEGRAQVVPQLLPQCVGGGDMG